jgi:nucleoside-diphosphate-sugar epimerase
VKKPTGTMPFWLLWSLETTLESIPFLGYGTKRKPLMGRQALALIGQDVLLDDSKIRRELGYEHLVTVEEGLEDAR